MKEPFRFTLDGLVKNELDGKSVAIARYGEILWKVRTGYAVLLYGAVAIIAGLVNADAVTLGRSTGLAATTVIVGFSLFGALLDYSFIKSKLRVVDHRDHLLELCLRRTASGAWPADGDTLLEYLKNSGERTTPVDWSHRPGRALPLIYYGGTCAVCIAAIGFLAPILPW